MFLGVRLLNFHSVSSFWKAKILYDNFSWTFHFGRMIFGMKPSSFLLDFTLDFSGILFFLRPAAIKNLDQERLFWLSTLKFLDTMYEEIN